MTISMNEGSARKLYELCLPYKNFTKDFMDIGDFIEDLGIQIPILDEYFNAKRDIPEEDLVLFANQLRMKKDALADCLRAAYDEFEAEKIRERQLKEEVEKWKRECALKKEQEAKLKALKDEVLAKLKEYGVADISSDSKDYPLEDYYPLKFIIRYMNNKEYLPKLEALLAACSDEELVYKKTNALMWAADSKFPNHILLLLGNRREFRDCYIGQKDDDGMTVLHRYVQNYHANPDGIDLLVGWGADVNAKDNILWTPLHDAESRQNDALAGKLLKLGAINSPDKDGMTPEALRDRLDALDAW